MQISIQGPTTERITLDVTSGESIQSIKQMLQDKKSYPKDQQRLSLNNAPLEDDHFLSDYDIRSGTVLSLRIDLKVYLHLIDGKICSFVVEPEENIEDLKQRINKKLGIPVNAQHIIHRGIQLENNLSLSFYVFDKNTHNIMIKLRGY
ncbi:hypothetical protein [Parasitella parasitica]|uniref:Ubiquitin-like domain-containing protein n=1 Tax=Parasitella parasitica TaxID=35722 RepID=A0A0B7N4T8_9FUNG|nr:hypothetical protein [Parasitella parasitica]